MSMSHLIILGIIALVVIPPEKLPEMARQLAKLIYDIKRAADQVMGELKQEALFKPDDIIDQNIKNKLQELHTNLNQNVQTINDSIQNLQNPNKTSAPVTPMDTTTQPPAAPTNPVSTGSEVIAANTISELPKTEVKKHE